MDDNDSQPAAGEVEALLRRYRPVGPPAALRARVVDAAARPVELPGALRERVAPERASQPRVPAPAADRAWPWLAAAAVLLLSALALRAGGDGLIARADARLPAASAMDGGRADAALASVAETLGGDDIAWRAAAVLVRQERQRREDERAGRGDAAAAPAGDRHDAGDDMP
jgi:hypothetical protein